MCTGWVELKQIWICKFYGSRWRRRREKFQVKSFSIFLDCLEQQHWDCVDLEEEELTRRSELSTSSRREKWFFVRNSCSVLSAEVEAALRRARREHTVETCARRYLIKKKVGNSELYFFFSSSIVCKQRWARRDTLKMKNSFSYHRAAKRWRENQLEFALCDDFRHFLAKVQTFISHISLSRDLANICWRCFQLQHTQLVGNVRTVEPCSRRDETTARNSNQFHVHLRANVRDFAGLLILFGSRKRASVSPHPPPSCSSAARRLRAHSHSACRSARP